MRERCEKATEGPWVLGKETSIDGIFPLVWPGVPGAPVCRFDRVGAPEKDLNDATFITHTRTDLPRVLEELAEIKGLIIEDNAILDAFATVRQLTTDVGNRGHIRRRQIAERLRELTEGW